MIYPYGTLKFPTPFSDTEVDNIIDSNGAVDTFAPIDFALSDKKLIDNINERINDSKTYYDDSNGFNLSQKRSENLRMYLGVQVNSSDFYDAEEPYIENQLRPMIESIVAYVTARAPTCTVTPAYDSNESQKFASNLEKAMNGHSLEFDLRGLVEIGVRSWMLNQAAYIMLEFDPNYGDNGEIIPTIKPCDEIVIDKYARFGQNPGFIALFEKDSVEDLIARYPEKREKILESMGIKRAGSKNMSREIVTRKVYFTYYDSEQKPQEAVAVYYDDLLLSKYRDINWLHGRENFLKAPMKPIIPLNVINDGKHYVDFSSFVDDALTMQRLLNARGRQISLNADASNGTAVIDAKKSGLTREDAENWTRRPNQALYLKKAKDNANIDQMIKIIDGPDIKDFVANDKADMRNQMGVLMGVPVDQSGSDLAGDDPTLGEALLKKNSSQGRQDMLVRAVDRWMYLYFNFLAQMMFVWYKDDHFFPYLDSDGSFERLVIKRYYFDEGMRVSAKSSSTIAFDKNREQAMALHFADKGNISMLDAYRIVGFENPQKLYDNWVKQTHSPFELARDANEAYDSGEAYAEFLEFINGKVPHKRMNPDKEYILTLRKMFSDDKFLDPKLKASYRNAFVQRFNEYMENYELRTSLDQLGQEDMSKLPPPGQPVPPPIPAQQFQQMMNPQPPMPAPMPGQGLPGQPMPGMPPQQPMQPGGGAPGVFNGTPIVNPASPQTPNHLTSVGEL